MKILLFHSTTDSDLYTGLQVSYKDSIGAFTQLGHITDIIEQDGTKLYLINTAMGAFAANELKLVITPNTRYVITAIKKDGLRQMAFANNSRNTYATRQEANQMLSNVIANNNEEDVLKLIGKDLRVTPVECYMGGDAKRTIF